MARKKNIQMRKTKSSDCVLLSRDKFKDEEYSERISVKKVSQNKKASRYSCAHQGLGHLPPTPEFPCEEGHECMSSSSSYSSSTPEDDTSDDSMSNDVVAHDSRAKNHVTNRYTLKCLIFFLFLCIAIDNVSLKGCNKDLPEDFNHNTNEFQDDGVYFRIYKFIIFVLFFWATMDDNPFPYRRSHQNLMINLYAKVISLGSTLLSAGGIMLRPLYKLVYKVDIKLSRDRGPKFERFRALLGTHSNEADNATVSKLVTSHTVKGKRSSYGTESLISAPKLFISIDIIERMTLSDIALTFEFVLKSGNDDFELSKFLIKGDAGKPLSEEMTIVIETIIDVTTKSRGEGVLPSRTQQQTDVKSYGNIDALKFCAAMRIFAEWRVVRQVPPGYKGYAFGMDLGRKDIIQNISKIETATYTWINMKVEDLATKKISSEDESGRQICVSNSNREKTMCLDDQMIVRSPTLRDLLSHEKNTDYHDRLPRLKDNSAAMGLLWARRQFQYQTQIFENILIVPEMFPTAIKAVTVAYSEVYGKYHGWAIRKVFECSFRAAPELMTIYRHMNPLYLNSLLELRKNVPKPINIADTYRTDDKINDFVSSFPIDVGKEKHEECCTNIENIDLHKKVAGSKERSQHKKNPFQKFTAHITSEWNKFERHLQSEFDKFGKQVGGEWDKFASNIENMMKKNRKIEEKKLNRTKNIHIHTGKELDIPQEISNENSLNSKVLSSVESEIIIDEEMKKNAEKCILVYLSVVKPLLMDLAHLFSEMNMDDPSRV